VAVFDGNTICYKQAVGVTIAGLITDIKKNNTYKSPTFSSFHTVSLCRVTQKPFATRYSTSYI